MDENYANKMDNTRKLMTWISENIKTWHQIIGMGNRVISHEDYLKCFELLIENEFYEILVVFLQVHQETIQTYTLMEKLGLIKLSELWSPKIITEIKLYIINEIRETKQREIDNKKINFNLAD